MLCVSINRAVDQMEEVRVMRNYEAALVIHPNLEEEEIEALVEEYTSIIEDNDGEVTDVDEWGMRELAYEINDLTKGYYAMIKFDGQPELVDELTRVSKLKESIIRYLIVKDE